MQTNYILWEYFINFLEVVLFYILMQSKLTLKKYCAHIQTKQLPLKTCKGRTLVPMPE